MLDQRRNIGPRRIDVIQNVLCLRAIIIITHHYVLLLFHINMIKGKLELFIHSFYVECIYLLTSTCLCTFSSEPCEIPL